jgi:hypothetical protein
VVHRWRIFRPDPWETEVFGPPKPTLSQARPRRARRWPDLPGCLHQRSGAFRRPRQRGARIRAWHGRLRVRGTGSGGRGRIRMRGRRLHWPRYRPRIGRNASREPSPDGITAPRSAHPCRSILEATTSPRHRHLLMASLPALRAETGPAARRTGCTCRHRADQGSGATPSGGACPAAVSTNSRPTRARTGISRRQSP